MQVNGLDLDNTPKINSN